MTWLFLVGVALLPLMRGTGVVSAGYVYLADAFFVASMVMFGARSVLQRKLPHVDKFTLAVLAYFLTMVLSAMFGAQPNPAKLIIEIYVLGLALLSRELASSGAFVVRACQAWLVGAGITVVSSFITIVLFYAGIADLGGGHGSLPAGPYTRVSGMFLNFNVACSHLSAAAVMVWVLKPRRWKLALALIVVTALLTVSPNLGGLGIAIALLSTHRVVRIGGIVWAASFFVSTWFSPANPGEPSSRVLCWEAALDAIRANPLFGLGTGSPMVCKPYPHVSGVTIQLFDAHNSYLNIAATKGLLALLAYLAIAIVVLKRPQDAMQRCFFACFAVVFLYDGLTTSFEHTRHVWILAGMFAGVVSKEFERSEEWRA